MPDPLERYREIRDFEATPEPAGAPGASGEEASAPPQFVVQEHHATALHWDLRLERDGVLASWAVPKGIPADPKANHLAVHTEDHPLEYLDFAGDIPEGNYGAGVMKIWDRGTYERHKWTDREVQVTFAGRRVQGRYVLFHTDGRNWMIHRMDPPADPTRQSLPTDWRPMTAEPGPLPGPDVDDQWAYEILWRGARVLVTSTGGRAQVRSASGADLTGRLPEVRAIGGALGTTEVILDGAVTADDLRALDRRLTDAQPSASVVRRLSRSHPARLMVFDLLWLEGHPTIDLPYTDRRRLLADLALNDPSWSVPSFHVGDGPALLETARAQGLPGVVAKRVAGIYRPGQVAPDWRVVPA
jgi:bifunctional non-homologous end joining protein LigD